jgi:NhaP-type Na+/H+ or K+/H+ antiporter
MTTSSAAILAKRTALAVVAALLVTLLAGVTMAPAADAAEQRERIQLVERPRDAFALAMYGTLGLITLAGLATLRRQLKGEREQSDGEFRWR